MCEFFKTITPSAVARLTVWFESVGHKLYMDSTALSFLPHVAQNYHTSNSDSPGEGPKARGGKGALTSGLKTMETSCIHQPTKKTWLTAQPALACAA
jgi:hypothetical protein